MDEIKEKIEAIEAEMLAPDFWSNKDIAQEKIRELNQLKEELAGVNKYDKSDSIVTIFAGAGGDDAEDWARMLFDMYLKWADNNKFDFSLVHQNVNDHGGYRNITFELRGKTTAKTGKGVYGILKNESGVHRLVRISPFNAKSLRHTSFALVEVIPCFDKIGEVKIPDDDLKVEFSRSSGPGGQNVNKRETAVRVVHLPTNLAVHVDSERSQQQNRDKAMTILAGKLYKLAEEERLKKEKGLYVSKTTDIEWGNQIRSYVLHPYKMVKDHRTDVETSDVEGVLSGDIEKFLIAEAKL
ncbi:MAG TPA: PCRF domain-containing protein [Candidatus Paceibacterota bacterium]|nr:PCRF domain-containing protein [Candidatus Paceibacterota bacterium]